MNSEILNTGGMFAAFSHPEGGTLSTRCCENGHFGQLHDCAREPGSSLRMDAAGEPPPLIVYTPWESTGGRVAGASDEEVSILNLTETIRQAVLAERERCAKICELMAGDEVLVLAAEEIRKEPK